MAKNCQLVTFYDSGNIAGFQKLNIFPAACLKTEKIKVAKAIWFYPHSFSWHTISTKYRKSTNWKPFFEPLINKSNPYQHIIIHMYYVNFEAKWMFVLSWIWTQILYIMRIYFWHIMTIERISRGIRCRIPISPPKGVVWTVNVMLLIDFVITKTKRGEEAVRENQ